MPPKEKTKKGLSIKNNHSITCYVYTNGTLFKGDTYTYRGLFRRYGGFFSRPHRGYITERDKTQDIKSELLGLISGFLIYYRNEELDFDETELLIGDDSTPKQQVSFADFQEQLNDTTDVMDL